MSLKELIIQESMRLFSTKGYCSTSITDILHSANASKGGFYNHFASKEILFNHVLREAQRIWREQTLADIDTIDSPVGKIEKILENYRDRYLKDNITFPGGCLFVTFSVELDYLQPHLAQEVNKGFIGFKAMLGRLLEAAKEKGELPVDVNSSDLAEMLFAGMLGASVIYGLDKSTATLDRSIDTLIDYLEQQREPQEDARTPVIHAAEAPRL
jgi:TetR/AcrR family transcriptional regulator, transcriptional repressor for nem operon